MRIWPLLRFEIVQRFVDELDATHYLEVGTQTAQTCCRISVDHKPGVDPDPWAEGQAKMLCQLKGKQKTMEFVCKTSDDFFADVTDPDWSGGFDVIFIDGLHEREQWKRDISNAKSLLNPGGVIVCHDCSPPDARSQVVPALDNGEWVGDVWKGWVDLRQESSDMMFVIDTDYGVGVIIPSESGESLEALSGEPTYRDLLTNKNDWLNLISVEEFNARFSGEPHPPRSVGTLHAERA